MERNSVFLFSVLNNMQKHKLAENVNDNRFEEDSIKFNVYYYIYLINISSVLLYLLWLAKN